MGLSVCSHKAFDPFGGGCGGSGGGGGGRTAICRTCATGTKGKTYLPGLGKMKEHQTGSPSEPPPSTNHLPPVARSNQSRHQRPGAKQWTVEDEGCREPLPARGSDVNLLTNSLTSWLRRSALRKAAASGEQFLPGGSAHKLRAKQEVSEMTYGRTFAKMLPKREAQVEAVRSILKKSSAKNAARVDLSAGCSPHHESLHHEDDSLHRNVSADRFTQMHEEPKLVEKHYESQEQKSSSGLPMSSGGDEASSNLLRNDASLTSERQLKFVKRAGIFQLEDRYASGRQDLHGDDPPFAKHTVIDFETIPIQKARRPLDKPPGTSLSDKTKRSQSRKGLKVSWKNPDMAVTNENADVKIETNGQGENGSSLGSTSAKSEATVTWQQPMFSADRSQVPVLGVTWKVAVPLGRAGSRAFRSPGVGIAGGSARPAREITESSPASALSLPLSSPLLKENTVIPSHGFLVDRQHVWRKMYHRDLHPVTTAMEREGTSVSKTKWHVPSSHVQDWQRPLAPLFLRPVNADPSSNSNPSMNVQFSNNFREVSEAASALTDRVPMLF
ncbi:uncharacterized protein LOC112570729 isoform X2 [Pomacea canaliculata]|uniref:uncharacterized protein LOC112570729 isoform X2 n=1 Tax=Pomacea canaliculata TaxID=400727 RepID=UPI000D7296C5|nr:uncharacterized protein LOC112570729 isoform X2 [Pomacea canaliculata]